MEQPKPSTILLILAVFACVAMYVLGAGLGAQDRSSKGANPMSKQERERWRERFVKPRPVAEEDLKTTGCVLSEGTVRVARGLACRVDIAKSGARVRTVNVEPLSGSQVDVRLEPKGGPAVPATLEGLGERRGLDVPEAGATLSLTCTRGVGSTAECPVKLR
ncbi:hypothetical protein ATI61_111292 [Archangium gephyra]|uniref:Uncharacterized protein n=1 Tax=Archangium gephyra TaxID=48 RepID=A0AAC8QHR3_9BACT|nr:hypothetical protein [Archangium gephyra]AKJ07340.1 Hypothetical protein AA314_08966 [Archangium gephyra]REG26741.1 hypothetical protein ATI61_111292 [Archangium gephyra]